MFYKTSEPHGLPHDPFKSCIVPRPIAWVTSIHPNGAINLAPFSFFNALAKAWDDQNQVLQIMDEEPYDYAKVERHIPSSKRVRISFRVMQKQIGLNGLEFEAQTARGIQPMRLWWSPNQIGFDCAGTEVERTSIQLGRWHQIELELDCDEEEYSVSIDGKVIHAALDLEENPEAIERLVFRTGPWRMDVRQLTLENGEPGAPGVWDGDYPGADTKVNASIYLIDDLKTEEY